MSFGAGTLRLCKEKSREDIINVCTPYVTRAGASNTCYISLAGPQYIDSTMFHEKLGIPFGNMASAEHGGEGKLPGWNSTLWAKFSKPTRDFQLKEEFEDIDMRPYRRLEGRIIWYDSVSTSEGLLAGPVQHIFRNMVRPGSLVFLTFIESHRAKNTGSMVKRDEEIMDEFGSVELEAIWRKFCEETYNLCHAEGYGLKVVLSEVYASWPSGEVFVVGFEVIDEDKLDVNGISLKKLDGVDRASDPELTPLELKRLALIAKIYQKDMKKLRYDGFTPQLGIPYNPATVIPRQRIRGMADALTDAEVAEIKADFPLDYISFVETYEQPIEVMTPEESQRNLGAQLKRTITLIDKCSGTGLYDGALHDPVEFAFDYVVEYLDRKESHDEIRIQRLLSWMKRCLEEVVDTASAQPSLSLEMKNRFNERFSELKAQMDDFVSVYCTGTDFRSDETIEEEKEVAEAETEEIAESPEELPEEVSAEEVPELSDKPQVEILEDAIVSLGGKALVEDIYPRFASMTGKQVTTNLKGHVRQMLYTAYRNDKKRFRKAKLGWTLGRGAMRYRECRKILRYGSP